MGRPTVTPARFSLAAALLAAVIATSGCMRIPRRPVFPATLTPPSRSLVLSTWLEKNCEVGEKDDLEKYLRQYGPQLTGDLIAAFSEGPPQKQKDAVESHAVKQLAATRERIATLGLSPQDSERIKLLDVNVHAQRALNDFIVTYKSAALAGLGVVRTPEAVARLQQEAASQTPFQSMAGAILARIKKR